MLAKSAGDTLADASRITLSQRGRTFEGSVSSGDPNDYYRFRLTRRSFFSLTLRDLSANADVALLNRSGRVLRKSSFSGDSSEVISYSTTSLPPGVYFIRVYQRSGSTDYNLNALAYPDLRFDAPPPRKPQPRQVPPLTQRDLRAATKIETGSRTRSYDGSVSASRVRQIYRFDLRQFTFVTLALRDLSDNADIALLNSQGRTIRRSTLGGTNSEIVNPRTSLAPGTYYVQVIRRSGSPDFTLQTIGIRDPNRRVGDRIEDFNLVRNINPTGNSNPTNLFRFGDIVLFSANDGITGQELWRTDGTAAGTRQLSDINPGAGGSLPSGFVELNGFAYFAATNTESGRELWRTDGTAAGTSLVANINREGDSDPADFAVFNGRIYFSADNGINGRELWSSDGTTAGTVLVDDIIPGLSGSDPTGLTVSGNTLFFAATAPPESFIGRELWRSNGTAAGTVLAANIRPGINASSNPTNLVDFNGTLYFAADNGTVGNELWSSNGTSGSTQLFRDIRVGDRSSNPANLTSSSSAFYFTAENGANGTELWRSNGTPGGTSLVRDIRSGRAGSGPSNLLAVGARIFFAAEGDRNGRQLWVSNGTRNGTRVLTSASAITFDPSSLANLRSILLFAAGDSTDGRELFRLSIR